MTVARPIPVEAPVMKRVCGTGSLYQILPRVDNRNLGNGMKKLLQAGSTRTCLLGLALFLINFYVCRELFRIEYLRHMGSIEGAYIGISRYTIAHWRDLTWFPLWYGGVPFQNTYPPALHLTVALAAWMAGVSPAHAYHWVTALIYCMGPIAVFALTLRLSASRWTAFVAGAIYSSLSTSAWLVKDIAADLGGHFYPRRLQALVLYGEGPHVTGLVLIPIALLCLDLAVKRRGARYFVLAVLSFFATVLSNWLAALALALIVASYAIASIERNFWKVSLRTAAIGAAAYGLAMPWIPPSTIAAVQANAKTVGGDFTHVYDSLPLWGIAILGGLALLKLLSRRLEFQLQFAIFFTFLTALLTLSYAWWNIAIVPQPIRYHLEMEMAIAMLIAFVTQQAFRKPARWIAGLAIAALAIGLVQPIRMSRRYARDVLLRPIDITRTTEWKTAQWLNQHRDLQRVMVPGSTSFWLTAFSSVPELGGGFDQGKLEMENRIAQYEIYTGDGAGANDTEDSRLWLEAFGVQAVAVSGPASGEVYKPFRNPGKFEGVLPLLWREGGDAIYQVGRPGASLARVVPRAALVARAPVNGIDLDPVRAYVDALDDPRMPRAELRWISAHSAEIATYLQQDQAVSVQIAWHPGWHAAVNGQALPVEPDGLGQITVDPRRAGAVSIRLAYDGGTEMRIAHWLSALTAILLAGWFVQSVLKRD